MSKLDEVLLEIEPEEIPHARIHCPHCGEVMFDVSIAPLLAAWKETRRSIRIPLDQVRGFASAAVAMMADELWSKRGER